MRRRSGFLQPAPTAELPAPAPAPAPGRPRRASAKRPGSGRGGPGSPLGAPVADGEGAEARCGRDGGARGSGDAASGGHRFAPASLRGCTTLRSCLPRTEPLRLWCCPREKGVPHSSCHPPPSRDGEGETRGHTHTSRSLATGSPGKRTWPGGGDTQGGRFLQPPFPEGTRGAEAGKSGRDGGEGPAGAAGKKERRPRVGVSLPAGLTGGPCPQPQLHLLGAERRRGGTLRGATGGEPRGSGRLLGTQRGSARRSSRKARNALFGYLLSSRAVRNVPLK